MFYAQSVTVKSLDPACKNEHKPTEPTNQMNTNQLKF